MSKLRLLLVLPAGVQPYFESLSIFYCIIYVLQLFHSNVEANSPTSNHYTPTWPLRYHDSPWLADHKDFIIKSEVDEFDEPEEATSIPFHPSPLPDDPTQFSPSDAKTDHPESPNVEPCQKNDRTFNPSAHCILQMKKKRLLQHEEPIQPMGTGHQILNRYQGGSNPPMGMAVDQQPTPDRVGLNQPQPKTHFERCPYLTEALIAEMCHSDFKPYRRQLIERVRLRSCRRFALERTLSQHLYALTVNSTDCAKILRELLTVDNLVEELACEYESILARFDCEAKWSLWTCRDCKLAYRDWLCSTLIPYHTSDERHELNKPCISICEQVEQKCPHLHPFGKSQYAGEPVFLCIDPTIPVDSDIVPKQPYGEPGKCYNSCDLESCLTDDDEAPVLECPKKLITEDAVVDSELESHLTTQSNEPTEETVNLSGKPIGDEELLFTRSTETTPASTADFSDNFLDESDKVSTTTFNSWNTAEEDYAYVIQTAADSPNKQSQSGQYLELEPNFESKKVADGGSFLLDAFSETTTSSGNYNNNNQYQASFQEIYREALASTTTDPQSAMNELDKEINRLNDEFTKEDIQDDWPNSNMLMATTTPTSFEYPTYPEVPTGTESNQKVAPAATTTNPKASGGKGKSSSGENSTNNRFRHHNSRSKEQQQKNGEHRDIHKTVDDTSRVINKNEHKPADKPRQIPPVKIQPKADRQVYRSSASTKQLPRTIILLVPFLLFSML